MHETLSPSEARKLVLLSQRLPRVKARGGAAQAALDAITHLGYIQIDTLSVVARAHHHTLWNRDRRYRPAHLAQLTEARRVFEYWAHAAAYLPMSDYRFCRVRMRAIAAGQRHWHPPNPRMMGKVLRRITAEGPLRAQDFNEAGDAAPRRGMWDRRPSKRALEQLFMEGALMVTRRQGFHKVYDLTERVLPPTCDTRTPSAAEYGRYLVTRFLGANGLGRAPEIAYLRNTARAPVERALAAMVEAGEVAPVAVGGRPYYAMRCAFDALGRRLARKPLHILSPFDNLLIQRERMRHLFDFDYQIECYTPAAQRKYGYFALPLLWGGRLVARMDCKVERAARTLMVRTLACEPSLGKREAFSVALAAELRHFAEFNDCDQVRVAAPANRAIGGALGAALRSGGVSA